MKRIKINKRKDWESKLEEIGFGFHSTDTPYWDESAYYSISKEESEQIYKATNELWSMSLEAVQHVIDNNLLSSFGIPDYMHQHIIDSWENDVPSIYGRFDFVMKDGKLKLLEFNADTPTSLFECGVVQWNWMNDLFPNKDQFSSVHERLVEYWGVLKEYLNDGVLYFTCVRESLEDLTTVEYMRDCAIQGGIETKLIYIDEIGWNGNEFTDIDENPIKNIFKLYPWEWIVNEEFGKNIIKTDTLWIEPSWKMILSNKAILPILWELFPNHESLLECYFEKRNLRNYVKKPFLSREGANVELFENDMLVESTDGEYGEEGFIYQELFKLPEFDGNKVLIGSWVIGQESVGIGFRESSEYITNNTSRFLPHIIE
jgi:glutathionylspermidine synthase